MTIERTPWRESPHTQIWNVTDMARTLPDKGMDHPADDASLAVWLVHAPWMALAWHWHYAAVVHLRELPGQSRPPTITITGGTHEFLSMAVDPATQPDLSRPWSQLKFLSPISIVQQFVAENDAEALARVEANLELVAKGQLSLESDGREPWRQLLLPKVPNSPLLFGDSEK